MGGIAPILDTTIVNVALADLGRSLHASVATSQWAITGYLLGMGMAMPATQWLSGRFGNKRVWLWCLGVFLAGSALAGASWNISSLIVFRLVQGAAAGVMIPLLTTMLVQAAGRKRLGRVLSIAMMIAVVVPIFGPVAGGVIVSGLGWRWVFYVNPPICLAAMWLAWRMLPPDPASRQARSLDVPGLALLSPGLALIIYGLSQAAGARGFAATTAWAPLAGGLALTAAFTVHALRRQRDPLINLRLLRIRSYAASLAVLFLAGVSVYGPLLLIALFYQDVQGKSALIAGLLLASQGIGSLVPRRIAGKLTDRIGPRPVVLTGLVLTAAGTLAFAWRPGHQRMAAGRVAVRPRSGPGGRHDRGHGRGLPRRTARRRARRQQHHQDHPAGRRIIRQRHPGPHPRQRAHQPPRRHPPPAPSPSTPPSGGPSPSPRSRSSPPSCSPQ